MSSNQDKPRRWWPRSVRLRVIATFTIAAGICEVPLPFKPQISEQPSRKDEPEAKQPWWDGLQWDDPRGPWKPWNVDDDFQPVE